jgi:hypothetical protein
MPMSLTAERLREVLDYNPETGDFVWKVTRTSKRMKGLVAGDTKPDGRHRIGVDGVRYKAHRLAWLYVHGTWPSGMIDHIDGNPSNNAIANLRDCTMSQNQANKKRRSDNTSGYKGVYFSNYPKHRHKPWRARITVQGRKIVTCGFPTAEEAHEKYKQLAREHFGEFARFD